MSKVGFWLQISGEARKPLSARVEERLLEKRKNKNEGKDFNEMRKTEFSDEEDKNSSVRIDIEKQIEDVTTKVDIEDAH